MNLLITVTHEDSSDSDMTILFNTGVFESKNRVDCNPKNRVMSIQRDQIDAFTKRPHMFDMKVIIIHVEIMSFLRIRIFPHFKWTNHFAIIVVILD